MGWLPQSEFDRLRAEALSLSRPARSTLTWEDAARFVPADTIRLAAFNGARCAGPRATPWGAVCCVLDIHDEDAPMPDYPKVTPAELADAILAGPVGLAGACHGCGAVKDPAAREVYPYPEDDVTTARPVSPLFELDVEPHERGAAFKVATVCHHCFHRLQPDMWISQRGWEAINPVTPFGDLPEADPNG